MKHRLRGHISDSLPAHVRDELRRHLLGAHLERLQQDREHIRMLARVAEIVDRDIPIKSSGTAGGDRKKLRGIPVQAPGVGSTMDSTDPLGTLLAKEARAERDRCRYD